jgi:hypothetical protein
MRRWLLLLPLLLACVTEAAPLAPAVWYSVAPMPKPPRVGTVDRDRVVEAFRKSRVFHAYCAATIRERERAEQKGDQRGAAVMGVQEKSLLAVRDGENDPARAVPVVLIVLDRVLPQIAVTHSVDIIVDEGSWKGEAKNVIDLTDAFLQELPPDEG